MPGKIISIRFAGPDDPIYNGGIVISSHHTSPKSSSDEAEPINRDYTHSALKLMDENTLALLESEPTFKEAISGEIPTDMDPEFALRLNILSEIERNARALEHYEGEGDFGWFPIVVKEYAGLFFVAAQGFPFSGFYKELAQARSEALDIAEAYPSTLEPG